MTGGGKSKSGRRPVQAPRRKVEARVPRPGARRRQASPRVLIAAAAVLLLAGLGIGLGVALTSGSSPKKPVPPRGSLVGALPHAKTVQTLFGGIPQSGNVLGSPTAPVTMVEYVDLQCPYCDEFELQVLPDVLDRYVRTGKVRIEARPIAFIGPDSERGREAAIAAADQNKMFNMMELLYANQKTENSGWLSESTVEKAAASIPGLKVPELLTVMKSGAVKSAANHYDQLASSDNVRVTPTIYAGHTNGHLGVVPLQSPTDEQTLFRVFDAAAG
jgi:protein-disulfide isomerase